MRLLSLLKQPRLFTVLLLGFSSGLPLALTSSTLQAWFSQSGVSLMALGLMSFIGIPYVWKFLWAPLQDRFSMPWGGRRRGWIAFTQVGLCITLFILANLNPQGQLLTMGILALLIAFLSATQDIGIDAYRTEVLPAEERGLGAAIFIFAYRIAMLVSGALAFILADYLGWRMTYEIMAVLLGLSVIVTYKAPEPEAEKTRSLLSFKEIILNSFRDLLKKENITLILLFALTYKIGDALALALMTKFLLSLGFSLTAIGLSFKTCGLAATLLGAFVGGSLLVSLNVYRALLLFGLLQAFSNLMFVFLALSGNNLTMMVSAMGVESFCSGMSTAAFVTFFMSLCNPNYTATQFACLTALAAVGRVLLGPLAAIIVSHWGWISLYWCAFAISFPSLLLLQFIQPKVKLHEAVVQG